MVKLVCRKVLKCENRRHTEKKVEKLSKKKKKNKNFPSFPPKMLLKLNKRRCFLKPLNIEWFWPFSETSHTQKKMMPYKTEGSKKRFIISFDASCFGCKRFRRLEKNNNRRYRGAKSTTRSTTKPQHSTLSKSQHNCVCFGKEKEEEDTAARWMGPRNNIMLPTTLTLNEIENQCYGWKVVRAKMRK